MGAEVTDQELLKAMSEYVDNNMNAVCKFYW